MSDISIENTAVKLLKEKGLTVFTAESCTGGLICKLITDISGASAVLKGGIVCYTNEIKTSVLGVKTQTINEFTEVSEQCCAEMAERARLLSGSDFGLSVTGYASGGDGVPDAMAGVVFLGISDLNGNDVRKVKFDGTRDGVRQSAARFLLGLLVDRIRNFKEGE